MNILFRTDASIEMGIGHITRCLCLAKSLARRNRHCEFLTTDNGGIATAMITKAGFTCNQITTSVLCTQSQLKDAEETILHLKSKTYTWVIVDSYLLDEIWEMQIRPYTSKILVIDDILNRRHSCDLFLDQNPPIGTLQTQIPLVATKLLGPEFALIDDRYADLRENSLFKKKSLTLNQITISFGGTDPLNLTCQVLELMTQVKLPSNCSVTVVMGKAFPWKQEALKLANKLANKLDISAKCVSDISDLPELLTTTDLAVGAAGSSAWERACLGVPSILFVVAPNQQRIIEAVCAVGAAVRADAGNFVNKLNALIASDFQSTLSIMSANSSALTDGKGAHRVVEALSREIVR